MEQDPYSTVAYDLPEQFGRYRIVRRLGQGGMGTVYLALDTELERRVALKVCQIGKHPEAPERFRREAKAAAALDHPNLCTIFDCGIHDGTPYYTMKFIEGQTLNEWAAGRGGLAPDEAADLIRKLALALHTAHVKGVIHRDLKPGNVVMNYDEPIIIDFGLARVAGQNRLTHTGMVLGSPRHMAPEQVEGNQSAIGPATDVYALGVILYELLTGRLPFDEPDMLLKIILDAPQPPRSLRPDLDPALEAICLKCLAKKPGERFRSMQELADSLANRARPQHGTTSRAPATAAVPESPTYGTVAPAVAKPQPLPTTTVAQPQGPHRRLPRDAWIAALSALLVLALVLILIVASSTYFLWNRNPIENIPEPKPAPVVVQPGKPPPPEPPVVVAPSDKAKEPKQPAPAEPPLAVAPFDEAKAIELQRAWAMHLGRDVVEKIKLSEKFSKKTEKIEKVYLEMVLIPPGKFKMGSADGDPAARHEEKPQREVTISKPFYLGKYELTQGQYQAVMGMNPSWFKSGGMGASLLPENEDWARHPVESLSWNDANTFCKELTRKHGEIGKRFVLPSEAQWEYACRAGTETPYYLGSELRSNQAHAFKPSNTGTTSQVGKYPANAWGLHDMHGNVWEYCADYFAADYYAKNMNRDPRNDAAHNYIVLRGGSWYHNDRDCRSATRHWYVPGGKNLNIGMRLLLPAD